MENAWRESCGGLLPFFWASQPVRNEAGFVLKHILNKKIETGFLHPTKKLWIRFVLSSHIYIYVERKISHPKSVEYPKIHESSKEMFN